MGMDVYGKNPKQNKPMSDFPILYKYNVMERESKDERGVDGFKQKWEELNADHDLRDKFWEEQREYERINAGNYFRNNCWWWRPLWNYCRTIAPDLIDEELFDSGHSNSGAGLDDKGAKELGERLLSEINNGHTIQYQASYQQYLDDLPEDDCGVCGGNNRGNTKKKDCNRCEGTGKTENFNKSYPFDIDNVREFAEFCLQCGGFEIC